MGKGKETKKMNHIKWMTKQDEKAFLSTLQKDQSWKGKRDYALCIIGFMTGARLSEIFGLNVGDVKDQDRLLIRAEMAKRHKERTVPLNKIVSRAISEWLLTKEDLGEPLKFDSALFVSQKNGRLSRRSVQEMFTNRTRAAGLQNRGYTVHSMRHSFAKRLVQNGTGIEVVQKLLGHASLASTGIYIEPGFEEMEEAVNGRK